MIDEICINSALLDSAKEVFETMIFMDLEECSDPEQNIEDDVLLGTITFNGDIDGCLTISCNLPCAHAIGANMLGAEPNGNISQEDIFDAIGEVTNMVMGSLKTKLMNKVGNLNVSIPIVVSGREIETNIGEGIVNRVIVKANIDCEYITKFSLMYKEGSE